MGNSRRETWLARYRESGQSVREFAGSNAVGASTLYAWLREESSDESSKAETKQESRSFVELKKPAPARLVKDSAAFRVRLSNGVVIEFSKGCRAEDVRMVLKAVAGEGWR